VVECYPTSRQTQHGDDGQHKQVGLKLGISEITVRLIGQDDAKDEG
jgi:hypothetical protein